MRAGSPEAAPWLLHGLTTRLKLTKQVARARRRATDQSTVGGHDTTPRAVRPGDQEACQLRVEEAIPVESGTTQPRNTRHTPTTRAASATDAA